MTCLLSVLVAQGYRWGNAWGVRGPRSGARVTGGVCAREPGPVRRATGPTGTCGHTGSQKVWLTTTLVW